jgi:hypothetical protein
MKAKKKLIARMALAAAIVLVVGAAVAGLALLADYNEQRRYHDRIEAEGRQRLEDARGYLAAVAKKIDKLPVDRTLAYEVESKYFEERPRGPFYLWAMDTNGGFVFGVPQSAFDKLNAIYDREVTPRLKEGVFLDRQTFLLGLIDDSDRIGPVRPADVAGFAQEERFHFDRSDERGAVVFSAPLKTTTGAALGSVYLKQMPYQHFDDRGDADRFKVTAAAAGVAATLAFFFLWILLPTWVYVDGRERGVRRAPLFAFLTALSSLVGLVVYLIARPEQGRSLTCPGCAREVDGGAFCPHCGRDLSRSICPACRYPLQGDWMYCPGCRTEIKAPGITPAVVEAG